MLRRLGHSAAVALMLTMVTAASNAQTYPTRTVRLIVGFAAGGGTDVVARLLAQKLAETTGQPFVVENRPGATGTIGAKAVATSPPDGYMLLLAHVNSQAIAPALSENPPYDADRDFAPVAYIGFVPNVLVVNPALPVKTLSELVDRAKTQPNGVFFASPGVGSTNHLAGEMLRIQTGAKFVHVPYRGSAPATTDLLGGQVDLNFDVTSSVMQYVRSGHLRALAVTADKRDPDLPDVPTMAELGFRTFDITNWYGVAAPAGTPQSVVDTLHGAIQRVLDMPDVARKLTELGIRRQTMTPEEFAQFGQAELAKYRNFKKTLGVRLEL
jgi:tripartite-type tricarboxylate transporter receptor subunit TctC